jgi:aspartyl aminopeptidase
LAKSPSAFHCVKTSADILLNAGYTWISETDDWQTLIKPGGK